jgi:O-antigen/teichoic acid export membrane protein
MGEYSESVAAKLLLFVPSAAIACGIAWLVARDFALFAGAGALSMASVGLTAGWYFVGAGRPFAMLLLETAPRVAGSVVGILFMESGSSALVGVMWQLLGMLTAFAACSLWILRPWRLGVLRSVRRRPVVTVLAAQRPGITSSILSSIYASTPIVIVTLVAPAAQPVYAVVEKVQRQVIVGLGPFVTVLQGWIPRARTEAALHRRVRQGTLATAIFSVALGSLMLTAAPRLIEWLGGGVIRPSFLVLTLMAAITAVSLFESVASKACLSALGRLDVVARSTAIGSIVGLPLVGLGALTLGALGALVGILIGLALRLVLECVGMRSAMANSTPATEVGIDPQIGLDGA